MRIMVSSVGPDEPCYGLFEAPMTVVMPDGSTRRRWIQRLRVNRGDRMAYYEEDLGDADDFKTVTPLAMPSFGDDTVAELRAYAEKNRHDDYWTKRAAEMLASSTLVEDHLRQLEILREIRANRSVLGPGLNVQRNEFPLEEVTRTIKEKRDDRRGYKAI